MFKFRFDVAKLLEYRKRYGYTQVQMGEWLGIKQPNYCDKEGGKKQFSLEQACEILEIFNIPTSELGDWIEVL